MAAEFLFRTCELATLKPVQSYPVFIHSKCVLPFVFCYSSMLEEMCTELMCKECSELGWMSYCPGIISALRDFDLTSEPSLISATCWKGAD